MKFVRWKFIVIALAVAQGFLFHIDCAAAQSSGPETLAEKFEYVTRACFAQTLKQYGDDDPDGEKDIENAYHACVAPYHYYLVKENAYPADAATRRTLKALNLDAGWPGHPAFDGSGDQTDPKLMGAQTLSEKFDYLTSSCMAGIARFNSMSWSSKELCQAPELHFLTTQLDYTTEQAQARIGQLKAAELNPVGSQEPALSPSQSQILTNYDGRTFECLVDAFTAKGRQTSDIQTIINFGRDACWGPIKQYLASIGYSEDQRKAHWETLARTAARSAGSGR